MQDHPYRWLIVLLLLALAALFGVALGSMISVQLARSAGFDFIALAGGEVEALSDPQKLVFRLALMVSNLFMFTFPSLLVAWLLFRRQTASRLQLNEVPRVSLLGLLVLLLLAGLPVIQLSLWLNQLLPLPDWMQAMEDQNTGLIEAVLYMDSPGQLLLTLLAVAVTPALGEELFFRGIMQQEIENRNGRAHFAIWITAIVFSGFHLQFAGFFPRLLLGLLLGYSFYWTRNLWVPILLHFLFNGSQVFGAYLRDEPIAAMEEADLEPNFLLVAGSALVSGWLVERINRSRNRNGVYNREKAVDSQL